MSSRYTPAEITAMSVGNKKKDKKADIDLSGNVTTADARKQARINAGLEAPVAPRYTENTDMSERVLSKILASPEYTYDINADPLYRQYRDMYESQGRNAAEDVFGMAAAASGGYGNSYAASVAQKAYDSYLERLAGKAGELEQQAYSRNKDRTDELYKQLDAVSGYEDRNYDRFRDDTADYYKDLDNYKKEKQSLFDNAVKKAEMGDYSALKKLGVDTTALEDGDKRALAKFKAEYSDYSGLEDIGVNTDYLNDGIAREDADFKAKYYDYSGLKKLGIDTSKLSEKNLMEVAKVFAAYEDYDMLERLGANMQSKKERDKLEKDILRARYYNYYR